MCSNKCTKMARKCDMPQFCSKRTSELYPSVSWILFYDTTSTTNERIAYASNASSQIHRNPKYISPIRNHHSRDSKNNSFRHTLWRIFLDSDVFAFAFIASAELAIEILPLKRFSSVRRINFFFSFLSFSRFLSSSNILRAKA